MKTLDEFKHAGGITAGSKSTAREEYEGQPRPYNDKLSTTFDKLGFGQGGTTTSGATGTHRNTDSGIGMDSPNSSSGRNNGIINENGRGSSGMGQGRSSGIANTDSRSAGTGNTLGRSSGGTDGAMRG